MALNLSSHKLKSLKHISFLTGCGLASNKTEIQRRLAEHIGQRHLLSSPIRVVSVDMGIRNLAYCVVDLQHQQQLRDLKPHDPIDLKVNIWKKLDLTQQLRTGEDIAGPQQGQDVAADAESLSTPTKAGLFSPANVSKLAYGVSRQLLNHKPDVILIEEQRFRSSGGSAIQEWTVRVNMLESMLWACLETLKHQATHEETTAPSVYSVNPAKVAKFWTAGNSISLSPSKGLLDGTATEEEPRTRVKITKKDKIAVLKSWLHASESKDVTVQFSDEAQTVADYFTAKAGRQAGVGRSGKLDDLTDCLLQGAAWLKWQYNSEKVFQLLHE